MKPCGHPTNIGIYTYSVPVFYVVFQYRNTMHGTKKINQHFSEV